MSWSPKVLKSWNTYYSPEILKSWSLFCHEVPKSWSPDVLKSWSTEVLMSWSPKILKSWWQMSWNLKYWSPFKLCPTNIYDFAPPQQSPIIAKRWHSKFAVTFCTQVFPDIAACFWWWWRCKSKKKGFAQCRKRDTSCILLNLCWKAVIAL